jgi:CHAT domain-containing protein/tetratricopeptide (TPR) repeat protein
MSLRSSAALAAIIAFVLSLGCHYRPEPADRFAEGAALRAKNEKEAMEQAVAKFGEATTGWTATGRHEDAATAAQQRGHAYHHLGLLKAALDSYRQALLLSARGHDRILESDIGSDVGSTQSWIANTPADFDSARRHCDAALTIARQQGAKRQEVRALQCLGEAAYYGQLGEEALARYSEAARVLETFDDRELSAQNLRRIGRGTSDLGRFEEARAAYEQALAIWAALGDQRQQAIVQVGLARLDARNGAYQHALEGYGGALARLEKMGDGLWQGSCLTGIAEVQSALGDTASASGRWEQALQIFEGAGVDSVAIDVTMSLGANNLARGDDATALRRFESALQRAEALGTDRWKAFALRFIGVVYLVRKQPAVARPYLERALELQQKLGDSAGYRLRPRVLNALGEMHRLLGEHETAVDYLTRSLAVSRTGGDRLTEASTLYTLARSAVDRNQLGVARGQIQEALQVAESVRSDVLQRDLRASYVASIYQWYELHVDILTRLGTAQRDPAFARAAFEASERARARSLLDALTRNENPAANAKRPAPLRFRQVQQLLDRDTVLVEYLLGEDRSYVWVVSQSGLATYQLPSRSEIEPLAHHVYRLLTARLTIAGRPEQRAAAVAQADRDYWREAARLSDLVLGPMRLAAGKRLLLVADGALHYLPFAALPSPGSVPLDSGEEGVPMAVQHEIVNIPSAAGLFALRQVARQEGREPHRIAVFADPVFEYDDPRLTVRGQEQQPQELLTGVFGPSGRVPRLPATRDEAEWIARLSAVTRPLKAVGFDATRAAALDPGLARYQILHFATHSLFDNTNPGASGILLSRYNARGEQQDGFVRMRDIYQMKLPVDLVVLSACNTALGNPIKGEGLVGMVRGFMQAGARRVVASHWKVDDEATGELMRRFYAGMLQQGRSPATGLREATLSIRQIDRWRAPFYWAAFVVQGEWR